MRKFVRHPSEIPIEIACVGECDSSLSSLHNLSLGGICCEVDEYYAEGTEIEIHIPLVQPEYEGHGVVVWCRPMQGHYDLGIRFVGEQEAYKTRMVEQVCHIEQYKQTVHEHEGRQLDAEQAAAEWIAKYASQFASQVD